MNAQPAIDTRGRSGIRRQGPRRARSGRERMCIVTRSVLPEEALIRFVIGPDGTIVPDLQARLPGRGVWVSADRHHVEQAVSARLFARSLKCDPIVRDDLPQQTAELLADRALGRLGLARKAGDLAVGFTKVATAIEKQPVTLVLVASDAADEGRRKIQAVLTRRFGPDQGPAVMDAWSSEQLSLAIGRTNVIHVAVLSGSAGRSFGQAAQRLLDFEGRAKEDAENPQEYDA